MPQNDSDLNHITERVIGCAFRVANTLGCGFLEKVYENALVYELRDSGLEVVQQHSIVIRYKDVVVGEYAADLVVEHAVIVELKATKALDAVHEAQWMNYLRATALPVCLLLNFGKPRLEIRRIAN
jgi:GxxExxY protein